MPITLFDPSSQKPIVFESGSEAKDAILTGMANFDPNQDVYLKDGSGQIVSAKGKDAVGYITGEGGYSLASDDDVYKSNRQKKFGGAGQTALAAGEGIVNAAGLGFGNALTKVGIDLLTPRDSDLAKKYGEAVQERAAENPMASLAGEVAGVIVDPLGAGGAVSKATGKVGSKAAAGAAKIATKTAPLIEKAVASPLAQKTIERAVQFGSEGAGYGGSFEAGRQLLDDKPVNGDAIISHMKDGAVLGTVMGAGFGATEAAAAKALKGVKSQTKKYLDKITGAKGDQAGEVFSDIPTTSLKKEMNTNLGREQKAIKLQEEAEGVLKYSDSRKEGNLSIPSTAKGLDLTDSAQLDSLGKEMGINDLGLKIKTQRLPDEPLHEFLMRAKNDQVVQNKVNSNYPYMNAEDQKIADDIRHVREIFRNLKTTTPEDIQILEAALQKERKLARAYEPPDMPKGKPEVSGFDSFGRVKYTEADNTAFEQSARAREKAEAELQKRFSDETHKVLSEYDYMKDMGANGKKNVYVFNEAILPESVTVKNLGKGVTPLDFEAGQMAKQYGMTKSEMVKKGNARLNEVADFILDRYPQQGSMIKRAMTSADHIFEEINNVKNKSINAIDESIEQALNLGGTRQRITTQDIANHIESEILPRFTDPRTGNPIAGLSKEYDAIKKFADEYRENGFTMKNASAENKYGQKVYVPLDVKELRQLRIKLDDVAKFGGDKLNPTAIEEAAREMRTWIEDEVMSRVGKLDESLLAKYKAAKKDYGLSIDAGKIVDAAAKKAAKEAKFSLFYSGVGSAVGASVAGVPGAIVGGLVGGSARNALKEFSGALSVFMSRNLAKNVENYERLIESTAKAFFRPVEVTAKTYLILPKDSDQEVAKTDYKRLMSELVDRKKYMEDFVDNNEDLFAAYPETSNRILQTTLRARDFLLTKIPQNPYAGNPWKESSWTPSPLEINKYMRYREAVNNPGNILRQIKDGYVTPEGIEVLDAVYPDTKAELMKKFIIEAEKAKDLPVQKRVELFKVFGIQLDSFMTGKNFIELQRDSNQQAQQTAQGTNFKPQNAGKTNIGKKDTTLGNSTIK